MSEPRHFYIGVKALIENKEGKILLLKADVTKHRKVSEPYWDIPGGRIEEGDGVQETLKREIEEEIGIPYVAISGLFTAVISNHEVPKDDRTLGLALMVYKASIPEGSEIRINPEEHIDYEWVTRREAAKRLVNKYPKDFTQKLLGQ